MDLLDLFLTPHGRNARRIRELQDADAQERRTRASADRTLDEQIAALVAENEQLRLWVAAVTEVLLAKGTVSDQELREAVERLRPPPAEAPNPFAGLDP